MKTSEQTPDGWRRRPIREIGEVITGRTPSTRRADFYGGEYNLVSPADLNGNKYVASAHRCLTRAGFEQCRGLPRDAVLVGCIGNVGKLGMVGDEQTASNQQINAIVCNSDYDPHFIYYRLYNDRSRLENAAVKTTVPILNKTNFESFEIDVPSLPEQQKIATVLGLAQRSIEQQERLIALMTELKKTLLHKLFTEGRRGEPQKQTEIGPIPESWEVVPLVDVAAIERGKFAHRPRNHPRFYGGSTPFVQTGDVSNCDGKIRNFSQTLNEEGVAISKIFPAGTILITIAANIGFTGILEFDSACPDSLIGLTPNHRISGEFLQYYLSTQQSEMDRLAPRGTQKNINIQFLKPWPIRLPPMEEQKAVVECLSAVDAKLSSAAKKRRSLEELFRTLLHHLMTAEIRINRLDLPEVEIAQ